jgi:hypothetical protein
MSVGLTTPATVVISGSILSPLHLTSGAIRLRAEAFTQSPDDARALINKANVFLALSGAAENSAGMQGTDEDVKSFFQSVQVKQEGERAVLNASMPYGFLKKMLAESAPELNHPSQAVEVPARAH